MQDQRGERKRARSDEANGEDRSARAQKAPGGRAGGVYIPPFRLKQMMADAERDQSSEAYQKMHWEALRKTLNGIVNKVNAGNIIPILKQELLKENILRGRGLLCQCIMKAQAASPTFTPVFAALIAVLSTHFPEVGELLVHRVLFTFKRAYKRMDKPVCKAMLTFLAHLCNQRVLHYYVAIQITQLLLISGTDDAIELAITFVKEAGAMLEDVSRDGMKVVFDEFRRRLQEGVIAKKTQYQIEGLIAIRRVGFEKQGHVAVPEQLDLVPEDKQALLMIDLDTKLDVQRGLNVFKYDPDFEQSEAQWAATYRELVGDDGEGSDEDDESASGSGSEEDDDDSGGADAAGVSVGGARGGQDVSDMTETDLVNLRRTLYLTIMSSLTFEEAGHKLLKLKLPPGREIELCSIICECCSQEKTFLRYYALLAQRFCYKFSSYSRCFEECFVRNYRLCHRLETNKLRNLAKLFAHLLGTDAITWDVLREVRVTEADTTSASRIFVKYLFQELAEHMGLQKLNEKLQGGAMADTLAGVFPRDAMANMRFSINFFTAIGLGGITEPLREDLAKASEQMKLVEQQRNLVAAAADDSSSDSESDSGSSSSGSSQSSGSR